MPELIKSVERVDDATVRFTLTRAEAPFIADLAMDFASILSKEYADKLAAEGKKEMLDRAPVGTGPFQFVELRQGRHRPLQIQSRLLGRQAGDR